MSEEQQQKKRVSKPHIPKVVNDSKTSKFRQFLKNIFFDCAVLFANIVVYIFFREVSTRGSFNLPKKGATIVVVAPHANQFVDGAIILSQIRSLTNRNSPPIIAAASYKRRFIGFLAKLANAIPVPRAQDNLKYVDGEVYCKDDDYRKLYGKNTHFTELAERGLIGLPESAGNAEIEKIISDTELVLHKPFKSDKAIELLSEGTRFKYAGKISNEETFQHVFNALHNDGIINIFPEGGSHDRPDLLPIKAGFAIMALGAVAADPSKPVQIVPAGLNYFHRNKFRSRAVVEFGPPIIVTAQDGEQYKANPREAVAKLLDKVTTAIRGVTVTAPDYETLQLIQATRRLYAQKVPLSLTVDMNRRLLKGYTQFHDDERVIHLKNGVIEYNKKLRQLGLKDHQVETATKNPLKNLIILLVRVVKLLFLLALSLPGILLFAPIFIVTDKISKKKQAEALAASVVKIKAIDVVATWKIIIATLLAPALYITYSLIGTVLAKKYTDIGTSLPSLTLFATIYGILVLTTYAAFRIGESGSDIFKSLPPLITSVFESEKELQELKETRQKLSLEVTEVVNELGPKVFPDFDRFIKKHHDEIEESGEGEDVSTRRGRRLRSYAEEDLTENERSRSTSTSASIGLSRVNSEGYLSDIPILGDGSSYSENLTHGSKRKSLEQIQQIEGSTASGSLNDAGRKLRSAMRKKIDNNDDQRETRTRTYV